MVRNGIISDIKRRRLIKVGIILITFLSHSTDNQIHSRGYSNLGQRDVLNASVTEASEENNLNLDSYPRGIHHLNG